MALAFDPTGRNITSVRSAAPVTRAGVVYGGSQDAELVTQRDRRAVRYTPTQTDWYNSLPFLQMQNRQNQASVDAEYLPDQRSKNNDVFLTAPSLGLGGVYIPEFGVTGGRPPSIGFTNPTPNPTELPKPTTPTAPKQPSLMDIFNMLGEAYLNGGASNSGDSGGGIPLPPPQIKTGYEGLTPILDQYYKEHTGANGEVAEARNQKRPMWYDSDYGWRLRDLYNEDRVRKLTESPKRGGEWWNKQGFDLGNYGTYYPYPWSSFTSGGGGRGSYPSYSDQIQSYYNALMNWRV